MQHADEEHLAQKWYEYLQSAMERGKQNDFASVLVSLDADGGRYVPLTFNHH